MLGITNFIIIYEKFIWKADSFNTFPPTLSSVDLESTEPKVSKLFPDRQRNLKGYAYKVALKKEFPRIIWPQFVGETVAKGVNIYVFSEIARHQNGSLEMNFISKRNAKEDFELLHKTLFSKNADLTLNTIGLFPGLSYRSMINTYDVAAYCALVPIPPRLSFLRFLLTPFDTSSWMAFSVVVLVAAFLFRFSKKKSETSSSAVLFVFGVISNFLGQAIPLRTTSRMQKIILYFCILVMFIMGNAYLSIINHR